MQAHIGDRLVIMSRHLDESVHEGEILEVCGANGTPPYRVHWLDDEHDGLIYPGPDARVIPRKEASGP